jgi:hypothetical protein
LRAFKREIDILKDMGANFVVVEWNSGPEWLDYVFYKSSLIKGLEYAKGNGLRTELVLHSRGAKPASYWEGEQINTLDKQVVEDWKKLLRNPSDTERLATNVDVWGTLAEARYDASGNIPSAFDPIYEEVIDVIRSSTNDPNAICSISVGEWGGDARELIGTVPTRGNLVIEIHPYYWIGKRSGFQEYVLKLIETG